MLQNCTLKITTIPLRWQWVNDIFSLLFGIPCPINYFFFLCYNFKYMMSQKMSLRLLAPVSARAVIKAPDQMPMPLLVTKFRSNSKFLWWLLLMLQFNRDFMYRFDQSQWDFAHTKTAVWHVCEISCDQTDVRKRYIKKCIWSKLKYGWNFVSGITAVWETKILEHEQTDISYMFYTKYWAEW